MMNRTWIRTLETASRFASALSLTGQTQSENPSCLSLLMELAIFGSVSIQEAQCSNAVACGQRRLNSTQ
jgi:hypothetical protein